MQRARRLAALTDAVIEKLDAITVHATRAAAERRALDRGLKSSPEQDSDDLNGGKEVEGMLLEARGDAASVFELVEEALDEIALAIEELAVAAGHPAVSGRRDAGTDASLTHEGAKPVDIAGLAGDEPAFGRVHIEQGAGGTEIVA